MLSHLDVFEMRGNLVQLLIDTQLWRGFKCESVLVQLTDCKVFDLRVNVLSRSTLSTCVQLMCLQKLSLRSFTNDKMFV